MLRGNVIDFNVTLKVNRLGVIKLLLIIPAHSSLLVNELTVVLHVIHLYLD